MADLALEHTRVCSKCAETKALEEFNKQKGGKFGRRAYCRSCQTVAYYMPNRAALITNGIARVKANRPAARERARRQYAASRAERLNVAAKYRDENREAVRATGRASDARRRATPKGRLENAISANISGCLAKSTKAGRRWQTLVGYSLDELMGHLETLFLPGMTWENYGKWHVDHRIPKSAFNYDTPDHIDFRRCWALSNLQPLWAADNMSKKDRLSEPFQPSLAL